MKAVSAIIGASLLSSASAFAPTHQSRANVALKASNDDVDFFDPLNLSEEKTSAIPFAATAAATFALHPLVAMAEEVGDDYEYGAVDAPIGIAWAAGVGVILTALLPLAMQGGEEAFEEMRQQDADTWGTGNSNKLNKRR